MRHRTYQHRSYVNNSLILRFLSSLKNGWMMALQSFGSNFGHVIGSFVGLATDSMLFGLLWVKFLKKKIHLIPPKNLNPLLKLVCLTGFDLWAFWLAGRLASWLVLSVRPVLRPKSLRIVSSDIGSKTGLSFSSFSVGFRIFFSSKKMINLKMVRFGPYWSM